MKRVIWHWTAGRHQPSGVDRAHYHFLIDGRGEVHDGTFPPEANERIVDGRGYAAHTRACNTGSIGVAVCAMAGAVERPFDAGRFPITPAQVDALVALTARLCREYGIPVAGRTVLSHAEVQPTLGIRQAGKIDIMWLPGMEAMGSPIAIGDRLRSLVRARMQDVPAPAPVLTFTPRAMPESWWRRTLAWLGR